VCRSWCRTSKLASLGMVRQREVATHRHCARLQWQQLLLLLLLL
jgi:hypothetical protein